ncbi:hypothetical protein [Tengunoibacter tsumagoiensis]|uniref:DUF2997 domain-containing protein n=1 Tax=Tengunoibacter tsumagoiensis TaxID=2014871 RepID=A0A402A7E6_9CHLR|nr:hypothetical protein [Tengunoibacter tsumagoiensis]GCE15070.1 hypothetical protein KTT_49290 [Tengunoibacter tsumagoiensis]
MPSLKTIHILVKEDGSVTTDFQNFTGADCLAAGKHLHALLAQFGVQVDQTTVTPKPELLAAQSVQQEVVAEANQEMTMEG